MSYILEALKRSQEERELGTVPTLASTPNTQTQRPQGHSNPWVLSALLLAALATAVALYALLNQGKAPIVQNGVSTTPSHTRQPEPASSPAAKSVTPTAPTEGVARIVPPLPQKEVRNEGVTKNQDVSLSDPPTQREGRPATSPRKAVIKTPSQARSTEPFLPAPTRQQEEDFRSVIRPWDEEESAVPADLREEIEAFKQRIEKEHETAPPAKTPAETIETIEAVETATEEPAPIPASKDAGETGHKYVPRLRALPTGVQSQIPPHRISVHVYSADPARRFVILNSRRMGEGDSSGDGLRLERIQPDGVVLSYGKHRFFSER